MGGRPFVSVKTTPPAAAGVLRRHHLFALIDGTAGGGTCWCTAPAGSGKTTFAASYAAAYSGPCMWLTLDEGDADPAGLFHYLTQSLQVLQRPGSVDLPRFTPDCFAALAEFARRFFRALYGGFECPWLWVLDNYHALPRLGVVHEVLRVALEELPGTARALVLSRAAPPPPFARLRLGGRLRLVPPEAFVLSLSETTALARSRLQNELPKQAMAQVHRKTQGWMAGTVVLLERLRSGDGALPVQRDGAPELLFDYFYYEVWRGLAPATQQFLMQVALLPQVTVAAARELTGCPDAEKILNGLAEQHQFTARHGTGPVHYQFHALFRDFLRAQGQHALPAGERQAMLRRAARWCIAHEREEDALALLRQAEAWPELTDFVLQRAAALVAGGRNQTLRAWLHSLPEAVRSGHPWLHYWAALAGLFFDPGASREQFRRAAARFAKAREPAGEALAAAGFIDATLFGMLGPKSLDPWIDRLETLLDEAPPFPSPDMGARALATFFRALMIRRPGHRRIGHYAAKVLALMEEAVADDNLRLLAVLDVAFYYQFVGALEQAFTVLEQVCRHSSTTEPSPMVLITRCRAEAWFGLLSRDFERAEKAIKAGLTAGRKHGVPVWEAQLLATAAALAQYRGDSAEARRWLDRLGALPEPVQRVNIAYSHSTAAWHALCIGDLSLAGHHSAIATGMADQHGMPFLQALSALAAAQIQREGRDFAAARGSLEQAASIARAMASDLLHYSCALQRAALAASQGQDSLPALRRALALGRRHGYRFYYWWRAEDMGALCMTALAAGIETEHVRRLIREHRLLPPAPPQDSEAWPWPVKIRTLGAFELILDDKPRQSAGKAQRRPLELLKALIALGGHKVSQERLLDALWGDSSDAYGAFTTTLQRLRKLLGCKEALVLSDGSLSLEPRCCCVDLWVFERIADDLERCLIKEELEPAWEALERLLRLYRGPFLAEDSEQAWMITPRERSRARFHRAVAGLGDALLQNGDPRRAALCFARGQDIDPAAEAFCRGAMKACHRLGDAPAVDGAWQRYARTLGDETGREPPMWISELYRRLHQGPKC
ncbi:MAG TPA: hypothetical protein ENJ19_01010 [Gammaproteobacteria bacterium]|nr:hypothetical protein [Gammaproteobacteria bacterium]